MHEDEKSQAIAWAFKNNSMEMIFKALLILCKLSGYTIEDFMGWIGSQIIIDDEECDG